MSTASTVGVRAHWTCARCDATAKTYQIVVVKGFTELDPPPGWTMDKNQTVCGSGHDGRDDDQEDRDGEGLESVGDYVKRRGRETA